MDFFQATIDRERGALDTLRMAGAAPLLVINDRWSEDWGERAAQLLLERDEMPDAVYCLNDEIARGMCRTLQMHGHRVPQDIAVIGHDNWDSVCVNVHPTLTSFDNELETMGRVPHGISSTRSMGARTTVCSKWKAGSSYANPPMRQGTIHCTVPDGARGSNRRRAW